MLFNIIFFCLNKHIIINIRMDLIIALLIKKKNIKIKITEIRMLKLMCDVTRLGRIRN